MKKEGLEDSINIIMQFKNDISGVVNINRHSQIKKEIFIIRGEKGIIEIMPSQYSIYDRKGNVIFTKKNAFVLSCKKYLNISCTLLAISI